MVGKDNRGNDLAERIRSLKTELTQEIKKTHNGLKGEKILELSEKLDELICEYIKFIEKHGGKA